MGKGRDGMGGNKAEGSRERKGVVTRSQEAGVQDHASPPSLASAGDRSGESPTPPPPLRSVPAGAPALCPSHPAGKVHGFGGAGGGGQTEARIFQPPPRLCALHSGLNFQCSLLTAPSKLSSFGLITKGQKEKSGGWGHPPLPHGPAADSCRWQEAARARSSVRGGRRRGGRHQSRATGKVSDPFTD